MSKKIRVLYAEDEQDIRENIVEILLDENFEVFAAENGKMALDMFLEKDFDVIVSDVMMPEMDGHDLLKAIRSNKDSSISNVPFIFLTALGQKEDIVKGIDLKANDYLTKPIDFDLLIGCTALEQDLIMVTENTKEFERISNIKLENWINR